MNVDFVQEQKARMSNSQPSTSRSPQTRYVRLHKDRRTCFSCGEVGHVSYKCPHSQKLNTFPQTPNTPRSKVSQTPKVKVDLGSKPKSVFSNEYEDHVAKVKKEQFAKNHDFFDICDPMSSVIFDKREKLKTL